MFMRGEIQLVRPCLLSSRTSDLALLAPACLATLATCSITSPFLPEGWKARFRCFIHARTSGSPVNELDTHRRMMPSSLVHSLLLLACFLVLISSHHETYGRNSPDTRPVFVHSGRFPPLETDFQCAHNAAVAAALRYLKDPSSVGSGCTPGRDVPRVTAFDVSSSSGTSDFRWEHLRNPGHL